MVSFLSSLRDGLLPMVLAIAMIFGFSRLSSILLCVADNLIAGIQRGKNPMLICFVWEEGEQGQNETNKSSTTCLFTLRSLLLQHRLQ